MFRAVEDAVAREAVGGVALVFLSVAGTIRFESMPFFGDDWCTLPLTFSCFLLIVLVLELPSGGFMVTVAGSVGGDSAMFVRMMDTGASTRSLARQETVYCDDQMVGRR